MTIPNHLPSAVFTGALGDTATNRYLPARAEVTAGSITLSVAGPAGWEHRFTVPAAEVAVRSAGQRITLVVRGQQYPILADPAAVARALGLGVVGAVAGVAGQPVVGAGADLGRGANQVAAARSWAAGGGPQFIAAASAAGARVSRLGWGAIAAIGCGAGLLVVVAVTVVTVVLVSL